MLIRKAKTIDIPALASLLSQVLAVHHAGRPDIFKSGTRKYTDEELAEILKDESGAVCGVLAIHTDADPTEENRVLIGCANIL